MTGGSSFRKRNDEMRPCHPEHGAAGEGSRPREAARDLVYEVINQSFGFRRLVLNLGTLGLKLTLQKSQKLTEKKDPMATESVLGKTFSPLDFRLERDAT